MACNELICIASAPVEDILSMCKKKLFQVVGLYGFELSIVLGLRSLS